MQLRTAEGFQFDEIFTTYPLHALMVGSTQTSFLNQIAPRKEVGLGTRAGLHNNVISSIGRLVIVYVLYARAYVDGIEKRGNMRGAYVGSAKARVRSLQAMPELSTRRWPLFEPCVTGGG